MQNEKLHKFFQKQLKQIQDIVRLFVKSPETLSKLLTCYDGKKRFNFNDFAQNLTNLFYTYYYLEEDWNSSSEYYRFLNAIMADWNYDIENCRIRYHVTHNQVILSFFKNPHAECVIQRMSAKFINELDQQQTFVFDLQAIHSEIEAKKNATKTFSQPQKKSLFDSIKKTFFPTKTDESIQYKQQQQSYHKEALSIQKARQQRFISILRKSIQIVLSQELPYICKLVMRSFKEKLDRQIKQSKIQYSKHYCSLIMTNWILSEFHYKFTMSHDEKGNMTNTELQNVSEILKAMTLVFQCTEPMDKNLFYRHVVSEYKARIEHFYSKLLETGSVALVKSQMGTLMVSYEHSLKIFSFNDVKIFCDLIRAGVKNGISMDLEEETLKLQFANSPMYTTKSRVNFRKHDYDPQNIYFMLKIDQEKVLSDINNYYLGQEYPLNDLPLLTQVLLNSSNLSVEETLELSKSLQFMKKLNSKQIIRNLQRLQESFKTLKINETKVINDSFAASFHRKIKRNLQKKCDLTRRKNNICAQIDHLINVVDLYKDKYKSQQFYQNVTSKFITLLKIQVYVGIEQGRLQVYKQRPESGKKLQIAKILMTRDSTRQESAINTILETSYRQFTSIEKVIEAVAQIDITKRAFSEGRRTEDFNSFFCRFCQIVSQKIGEFINEQKYLQHLNQQKFRILLNQKLGDMLIKQMRIDDQIQKDKNFCQRLSHIDETDFYNRQLADFNLQAFLFDQAVQEFNKIDSKKTAKQKIDQFDSIIKLVFSIISLSMNREKITAEVITPIMQYVVLKAQPKNCYKNLFLVSCLLAEYNHQTSYLITSWTAALSYLNSLGQEMFRMSSSTAMNSGSPQASML